MSIEGQGHFLTIYFPGFVCFVLYLAKISGERLQDHWSSGFISHRLMPVQFWSSIVFLAHLSRRLIGELIVYKGICRPSVVRPSVCLSVRQHFQTTSPLKPRSRFFSYFTYSIYRLGERIIAFFVQVG